MSTPNCPQCNKPLEKVRYPSDSMLNRDQWDSIRAGDYCCRSCPSNGRGAVWAYFWESEVCAAAAPLSAPRHLSEEANTKMINEIDEFQAKAEVASSPSPTRIGQHDEVVNGNLIEIWQDSQTKMYVTKFLEMLASGRTEQDAIESLQAMVMCQARMFAGEMAIIDGTLQEIKPRNEWVKVTPEPEPTRSELLERVQKLEQALDEKLEFAKSIREDCSDMNSYGAGWADGAIETLNELKALAKAPETRNV